MSTGEHPPTVVSFGEDVLDRMVRAPQRVQERLDRIARALGKDRIEFAVCGSNATAVWIASVDPTAVRQSRNVEIVVRRTDLAAAELMLDSVGFVAEWRQHQLRFLDGTDGKWRDAVEVTFAGEPVVGTPVACVAPSADESKTVNSYKVLHLAALIEFQLSRFRLDDAVDLRDMIDVGLIDQSWVDRLPPELASRLQELLDDPDG